MSKLNDRGIIVDYKYLSSLFDIIYLYIYIMPCYRAIFYINKVIINCHFLIILIINLTIIFDYVSIASDEGGSKKPS